MSARPMSELLTDLSRAEKQLRTTPPNSSERYEASMTFAAILEDVGKRTSAALGSAFLTVLLNVSEDDAVVRSMLGSRLLTELRRRGLEVLPTGNLPPA